MRFPEFIMELARKHSPISQEDYSDLKGEIQKDYNDIRFSKEFEEQNPAEWGWKNKLKRIAENPYARLGLIFAYLWLFRKIADWKNGTDIDSKDEQF